APADVTAEQTSADGTAVALGGAPATDICDADVTIMNDAPEVFPLGETTVTWTAMDASGNVTTETQVVTVQDTTPPTLSLPANITGVEQTCAGGTYVDFAATATDLCDAAPAVVCVPPSGTEFPLGTTMVTVTATDISANVATGTFTVTVVDTSAPQFTAPPDVTAEQTSRDGTPVELGAPTAADACDASPTVTNDAPAVFPLGTTIVTWTVKDASGNVATTTQKVT
ncbi:MAG: HYR domain-containing protein, partial [Armatimonadetes bacterium]|nr:HYR domain-containing protein [Armatimonadota bacterium]